MIFHCELQNKHKWNTMKKALYIFTVMKKHIHSEQFSNTCRIAPNVFIRQSALSCKVLFLFILNLLNRSIPKELISFCENCAVREVSRSAVTQARAKLSPKGFIELNDILLKEFYNDNTFKTFHGLTVLAIDGSTLQLPINSPMIIEEYGCATNQTKQEVPMSRISSLYDTMNCITWDAIMSPYDASERDMAIQHFERIKSLKIIDLQSILVIFDRGYPSLELIVYLLKNDIKFLMRSNTLFLKEVNDAVNAGKSDTIVKISLKRFSSAAKTELKHLCPGIDINKIISFRVVVVVLSTGEKEILLTSLLDKKQYPYKIFLELYFNRWGIEENYKFYKVQLEIENFSEKSCLIVKQDFHATVLAANAQALLTLEAEHELSCNKECKQKKYDYKINKKISMEVLKDNFVSVLLDPEGSLESFCIKTKNSIKRHLTPIRPGRSFPRIRKHPNLKYHMNQR
jgi:hypothetical protein